MTGNLVTVEKAGRLANIPERELQRGDTVVLQSGELVPADLRLLGARDLEVDEFDVTGQILPATKSSEEGENILYAGSRVLRGAARGTVLARGDETEYGRAVSQGRSLENLWLPRLAWRRAWLVLLLVPAWLFLLRQTSSPATTDGVFVVLVALVLLLQNGSLIDRWMLSAELQRLTSAGILVQDATVLERLSRVDTVCFDKTGVLTTRDLNVLGICYADKADPVPVLGDGLPSERVKLACALCHDVAIYEKLDLAGPLDRTLISFAMQKGVDIREALRQYQRIYEKPFRSENRYMACGYRRGRQMWYFAKGDPSALLGMCNRYMSSTGAIKRLDSEARTRVRAGVDHITASGGTAIALAYATGVQSASPPAYTFLGTLHIGNPLRPGADRLIEALSAQRMRSLLLTGDRAETAIQVGRESGVAAHSRICITGNMIEKMSPEELGRQSEFCSVFAHLLPSQKGLLVRMLQRRGHVVAMVGDGLNDAIALRVADVSICFAAESSPVARRTSSVLISHLTDVLTVMDSANRIKRRISAARWLRTLSTAACILGPYVWLLASRRP